MCRGATHLADGLVRVLLGGFQSVPYAGAGLIRVDTVQTVDGRLPSFPGRNSRSPFESSELNPDYLSWARSAIEVSSKNECSSS